MDQVIQIIHQHGLLSQVSVSEETYVLCEKKCDTDFEVSQRSIFVVECPKYIPNQKVNELSKSFEPLPFDVEISHKYGKNEKMPAYKDLHQVLSVEPSDLAHKPGEVLLVDIWATWCGPCQKPMQHNQEMLNNNAEKWKDKVRIVAVSVDEERNLIQQRINSKGWTKIEHLTLLGWKNDHPLISNFEIQGIPFVFLVDKEGKINFTGHPSEINLQQRINQLIEAQVSGNNSGAQQEIKEISTAVTEEINAKKAILNIFKKQALEENFGKAEVFQAVGMIRTNIDGGKVQKAQSKLKVAAFEDNAELIQDFKALLKDASGVEIEENLVKYTVVPDTTNAVCTECKAALSYPFYWCRWDADPNSFRCRQCTEKPSQQEGLHYAYGQNSVLLSGPVKKIALKGLGKNIQPDPNNMPQLKSHAFGCNGCGGCPHTVGEARYICLGCRNDPNQFGDYVDLCNECFKGYFEGNNQLKTELHGQGHKQTHPMLRILYNVQGYYTF